jgi:carboxyl-terminal processing protease
MKFKINLSTLALSLLMITESLARKSEEFYEGVTRLNKVLNDVNRKYVEEVDTEDLVNSAIEGLRDVLDPHTAVFSPKDYDNLKVSTDGEFGGLGITIAIREKVLTIISPLQGTPAFKIGLQAGDKIVKIDGESTKSISINDAVDKLRGKIGTDVTISIVRSGHIEIMDFTITRDKIVIHSVPYSGMLNHDIGYIKVAQFAKNTGRDVKFAIEKLQSQGMKKLILDLRYNPGGLLSQAIEVSDLFLDKGKVIVSTKGRTQQSEARAENKALVDPRIPIVTLINEGSASASEIVSGALQDWDRSLLMGKTTFGKGSVQTIYPLDAKGNAIKLTTAFYYLPMGRCINKPENGIRDETHVESDSIAVDSTKKEEVFYTNAGRKVYGGGGITPDLEAEATHLTWMEQIIERQSLFFKFAVKVRPALDSKKVKVDETWEVPSSLFKEFEEFVLKDSVFNESKGPSEASVKVLEEVLESEKKWEGDTLRTTKDEVEIAIEKLKQAFAMRRTKALQSNAEYIRRGIKRELLGVILGDSTRTAYNLKSDTQVLKAIEIIADDTKYQELLTSKIK